MKLKVKKLAKERGLRMEQLAEAIDVHKNTLTRMIQGNPTVSTLGRIAEILNVKVPELFEDQPEPEIRCPHCGARLELKQKESEPLDLFSQK